MSVSDAIVSAMTSQTNPFREIAEAVLENRVSVEVEYQVYSGKADKYRIKIAPRRRSENTDGY